jgi:hypothetical protein
VRCEQERERECERERMAWQTGKTRQQTARGPSRQLGGRAQAGDAALQASRRSSAKTTWRVVITAIDGEEFQANGRGDLRMQQAAAKFSHEILWW